MSNYEGIKRVTFQDNRFLNIKNWRVRQLRGYIIWGTLIIENGSFKLKSIVNVSAEVDDIGRAEKFCFFFPAYIIFFFSSIVIYFFRLPTRLILVSKNIWRFFSVMGSRKCADLYIFFTSCLYVFFYTSITHTGQYEFQHSVSQQAKLNV